MGEVGSREEGRGAKAEGPWGEQVDEVEVLEKEEMEEVELEFEEEEGRGQSLDHAREVGREV